MGQGDGEKVTLSSKREPQEGNEEAGNGEGSKELDVELKFR